MRAVLSEILLFSCMGAFFVGLVIAAASLLGWVKTAREKSPFRRRAATDFVWANLMAGQTSGWIDTAGFQ
jgi:hypothetical protein